MTKANLKNILTAVRDMINRSRIAYKDYLGEETVTETKVLMEGTLSERGTLTLKDPSFTGFVVGEGYEVTIDGATQTLIAISYNGAILVTNTNFDNPGENYFGVGINPNNGQTICKAGGTYIGKTISISQTKTTTTKKYDIKKVPQELIPDTIMRSITDAKAEAKEAILQANGAARKSDPVFTGSFSQNRKKNTVIGSNSHAEGENTTASGDYSHAEGKNTTASVFCSHAEGSNTTASGVSSHAEGGATTASGDGSHAEGNYTEAIGVYSHAEGNTTEASGDASHAEGNVTKASGPCSHAEGNYCNALGKYQHVQGKYNIESGTPTSIVDSDYAHIVGNGTSKNKRSNAHTLTWSGVPWYQGRPQFGGTAMDNGAQTVMANGDKEIILASSTADSTKKFKITVDDTGTLSATEVT